MISSIEQRYRKWFGITLANFLVAACFGALLRLAFVTEMNWVEFRYLMHGHSHLAMLGWLYCSLYILFLQFFIPEKGMSNFYNRLFWLTQLTVWGMAISFPLQGYGTFSIFFSSVHVFLSYAFLWKFFKDIRHEKRKTSNLFAKTALALMFLSTLGLFAMPPIMILDFKSSSLYYMAVQFFLHFQFNGWFIFGILAILFKLFEKWHINILREMKVGFYWTLLISCFLTYALAVTWSNPSSSLFLTNSIGVIVQFMALLVFIFIIKNYWDQIKVKINRGQRILFALAFFSICLKIIVQAAVVAPYIATIAYTIRNYVIGFIHLIMLGVISFAILSYTVVAGYLSTQQRNYRIGLILLVLGFVLSELMLAVQGTMFWAALGFIPYYYEILFAVSCLMPLGILFLVFSVKYKSNDSAIVHTSNQNI